MPSIKDRTVEPPKHRARSVLGFIFNPHLGESARPLKETTQVFYKILAMLFMMNGLFPKNHPAFAPDSTYRLSFNEVMQTAWRKVTFTKEALPQTLFFFAVVSCIGVTVLCAFIAFFSLFVGKAHAQSTFTPPGGNQDLAQQFINYLFNGQAFTTLNENGGAGAASPVSSSSVIQCAMYTALGYYSDAILIVAAMILFYHLTWMTVETAHHGVVMGQRGNQVWAPIRLVFAVGLLVPVGATGPAGCNGGTGAGLNSGQILVITVAQWGSGLASNVWAKFVTALANEPYTYVLPPPSMVQPMVRKAIEMYSCQYVINWYLDSAYPSPPGTPMGSAPGTTPNTAFDTYFPAQAQAAEFCEPYSAVIGDGAVAGTSGPDCPNTLPWVSIDNAPAGAGSNVPNGHTTHFYTGDTHGDNETIGACGNYTLQAAPVVTDQSWFGANPEGPSTDVTWLQGYVTGIYNAQQSAFEDMLQNAHDAASNNIIYYMKDNPYYGFYNTNGDIVTDVALKYEADLQAQMQAALNGATDSQMTAMLPTLTTVGWAGAGAYFNRIAAVQTTLMNANTDGLPKISGPDINDLIASMDYFAEAGYPDAGLSAAQTVQNGYNEANAALRAMDDFLDKNTAIPLDAAHSITAGSSQNNQIFSCLELEQSNFKNQIRNAGVLDIMDNALWTVDHVAGCAGVWRAAGSGTGGMENQLGIQFAGENPLAEVAAFGEANIDTGFQLANYGLAATLLGGIGSGAGDAVQAQEASQPGKAGSAPTNLIQTGGALLSGTGGFLLSISAIFFTMGFGMAFLVPLVPFMTFFFGIMTWIVSMLEAVIAVPLIALAHLNPRGDGLPGEMARGSYFLIFQVFLRPVLMIFGLICGLLIFYLGVSFLNAMFAVAANGATGLTHSHAALTHIVDTVLYVLLVITTANHSFVLVNRLPDNAMQWMGAQGMQGATMGDTSSLEKGINEVNAVISNQGASALAGGANLIGKTTGRVAGQLFGGKPSSPGSGTITKSPGS